MNMLFIYLHILVLPIDHHNILMLEHKSSIVFKQSLLMMMLTIAFGSFILTVTISAIHMIMRTGIWKHDFHIETTVTVLIGLNTAIWH